MAKKLIFLGGTCGNNHWRNFLIEELAVAGISKDCFFDPVVINWNDEARAREEEAKKNATHFLFYLASPKQEDNPLPSYSLVEATMALYDKPETTIVVFDFLELSKHAQKALLQTERVLRTRFPEAMIVGSFTEALQLLRRLLRE